MNSIGCQPIFVATTSAVIVAPGVAKTTNVFAPAAFSATTCCVKFVAVTSYDCVATISDWSPSAGLERIQVVGPVGVVLVEDADLRLLDMVVDELGVDLRLARVVGLPADRPRVLLGLLRPVVRAGRDQHLRHLLLVQVPARRDDRSRSQAAEVREDLVLLDELLRERHRLRRVVGVVVVRELDLPPVDAAVRVGVQEVRLLGGRDGRVERGRPAERERAADVHRLGRHAGLELLRARRGRCHRDERQPGHDGQGTRSSTSFQCPPPGSDRVRSRTVLRPIIAPRKPRFHLSYDGVWPQGLAPPGAAGPRRRSGAGG